jgi:uracil-DNA glycosylase family 4
MDLRDELGLLRDLGYTHLDYTAPAAAAESAPMRRAEEDAGSQTPSAGDRQPMERERRPVTTTPRPEGNDVLLAELGAVAAACQKCRLAGTRTNVVYGVGNPCADLMFIGEAPGRDEDLKGEPFVGKAGQLLTDIIKAMQLTREQVYIANVIKCRPPENRNPEPDELDECRPYIRRQVELIQPRVIVTLGRFALAGLTEKVYSITAVRGHWLEYEGVRLMPTYHPAYLLRTPGAKKDVWADMKKVMAELGMEAPPPK